jgi:hypothetical protein
MTSDEYRMTNRIGYPLQFVIRHWCFVILPALPAAAAAFRYNELLTN